MHVMDLKCILNNWPCPKTLFQVLSLSFYIIWECSNVILKIFDCSHTVKFKMAAESPFRHNFFKQKVFSPVTHT